MLDESGSNRFLKENDEIDYAYLFSQIWAYKYKIVLFTVFIALTSAIYSLTIPNVYKAQALLVPSNDSSSGGISSLASQLGGIASLAGVKIGETNVDKTAVGIEVLKSRSFISKFITRHNLAIYLFAAKGFDNGELIIDDEKYDINKKVWNPKALNPGYDSPTDWDLYKAFIDKIKITQDKSTGMVLLSVEYYSPEIAKNWVDLLIKDLNESIRQSDVLEAQKSVDFLKQQLKQTSVADMHSMFYQLIEKQYQIILLANVREQYMFKVLDPAVVPQEKVAPKRLLNVLISIVLGLIFSTSIILIINRKK